MIEARDPACPVCGVCGHFHQCDPFLPGQYIRIVAWRGMNGVPPRLDKLPTVTPGRVVSGPDRDRDYWGNPLPGDLAYLVDFPGYGILRVQAAEMMHDDR